MIIPFTKNYKRLDGALKVGTVICGDPFLDSLLPQSGEPIINVVFNRDISLPSEGYHLVINQNGIHCEYADYNGKLYAVMGIKQLLLQNPNELECIDVIDYPSFHYRGYMLDVGRYYFPVSDILKQIEYCALYKINRFHIHLSEDQGWRPEIKSYPKLTLVGSRRSHTNLHRKIHEGYYTQTEMKKIVDYAHLFGMIVIPEIDMPGHFCAAIAAYPELSCFERQIEVPTTFGIKFEVACVAKENTKIFIKKVLDELCEVFTDEFFHIGGDEVPPERWSICPHCTKLKEKLGCANWEEYQALFMNEISDYLVSKGKTVIMWNEYSVSHKVNPELIWQFWNVSADKMLIEANNGRRIINSFSNPFYLDLPHSINSVRKIIETPVIPQGCERPDNIMGVEFPLWTELIPNQKQAEKMTFPRLICGAQIAWNGTSNIPFKYFKKQLKIHKTSLKKIGISSMNSLRAYPSGVVWLLDRIWWERRQLYWDGLHNIIDNKKVRKIATNKTVLK